MKENLSEHMEQVLLVNMALKHEKEIPELKLLYAIPNGGQRHKAIAQKLKMEGVKKGVPDLCLPVAKKPYNGLYIEMKRRTGGNVSVDQKKWL
ncbi:MAG: VRR-NUC domain-containing protein, partial [Proteobacteria bacterium]|nr:VRR-NUC domain-containing protein [Pseudomonadota bacterium]